MDSNSYSAYQNPTDSSDRANNLNELIPPAATSYNHLDATMPLAAPSYRHVLGAADGDSYAGHYSQQETFNRLMDSVYQSRSEDLHVGQYTMKMSVEDVHIVNGAIEIRARITQKPDIHIENSHYAEAYHQPLYECPPQYQPQYQSPYQIPYQAPYQYTYPSPYLNQAPVSPYRFQSALYPGQFPAPYFYQYPTASVVGGIANAISQLALTSRLLRRQ